MSRCKACNAVLSEEELVRKWPPTDESKVEYVDLCTACYCAALEIDEEDWIPELEEMHQNHHEYD